MNSSGIKRGLAASAVGALAVAGIPALATSASAAPGDVIQVQSTSTTRNAGSEGATIVLNTNEVNETLLDLAGTDLSDDGETNSTQDAQILTRDLIVSGEEGDLTPNNGLDQITLTVQVTTAPGADDTADFVIFEDEDADGAVDFTEPRTQASVETTGAVESIEITPATQSAPSGQASAPYTVTIRDADGDLTQLTGDETLTVTGPEGVTFGGPAGDGIEASEIADGTAEFTATSATTGSKTITVDGVGESDTAVLNVTPSADLDLVDLDVVTGADSVDGPGDVTNPVAIRVDQSSVRVDIASEDDANSTVTFTVTGDGVEFGGEPTTTVSTTLDSDGNGSVTITPDAGTIQESDSFTVDGSGIDNLVFNFERAAVTASSLDAPERVFTQVDTPTSVTVTVTDQFGNPVQGAQVSATSAGEGVNDTRPRQTTNASGQTTFTFPAGDTQDGDDDTITYTVYPDAATPDNQGITATETTEVTYTADGQGPDYQLTLDGVNTEAPTYSPDDVTVEPLTDAEAPASTTADAPKGDEVVNLTLVGGEDALPVEVSVNNGARILTGTETNLADGESTVTAEVGDTIRIVGTQSGIVTVTTTSGGRTETAQFTVEAQDEPTTARNVGVSGPATVPAGTSQVPFTAVITDAFGNPVPGVPVTELNVQVSGPGQLQDSGAVTDAQGQIQLNVRLDDDAEGPVTITVTGVPGDRNQFGDPATEEGLPASSNVASATTTVEAAPEPEPEPEPEPNPNPVAINPGLKLKNVQGKQTGAKGMDWAKVGARQAKGAKVKLFQIMDNGTRKLVRTGNISDKGQKIWIMPDKNRRDVRTFQAIVVETDVNRRGVTERESIR